MEFIKKHINPDPALANLPLSSYILSTKGLTGTDLKQPLQGPLSFGLNRELRTKAHIDQSGNEHLDLSSPTKSFASFFIGGAPSTGFGGVTNSSQIQPRKFWYYI